MVNKSERSPSPHYWIDFSPLYKKAEAISQAYNSNNLVFFLGPGVSKAYAPHMPDWEQLLNALRTKFQPSNPSHREEVRRLIESRRYLLAAEAIKQYTSFDKEDPDSAIDRAIAEILQQRLIRSSKNPILHLTLLDFAVPIITTNYDTIIERVISEYNVDTHKHVAFTYEDERDTALLLSPTRRPENYVFKLHGSISKTGRLIFDERDYTDFYCMRRWPVSLELLRHTLATKLVIFLGYSASDPEIMFILREATRYSSSYQHVALMLESDVSPIEKETLRSIYKVDPVVYENPSLLPLFVMEMRSFYSQERIPLRIKPDVARLGRALDEIIKQRSLLGNCPVIVFGSFAKYGTFLNPDADVDVLFLPRISSDEARIQSPRADEVFGREVDTTVMALSEFERLLHRGDPFASSVLLTGCPIKDPDGHYGILARGFRGKYKYTEIVQNAYERCCLRWLTLPLTAL